MPDTINPERHKYSRSRLCVYKDRTMEHGHLCLRPEGAPFHQHTKYPYVYRMTAHTALCLHPHWSGRTKKLHHL